MENFWEIEKAEARQAAPGKMPDMETFASGVKKELERYFNNTCKVRMRNVILEGNVPASFIDIRYMGHALQPPIRLDRLYLELLMSGHSDPRDMSTIAACTIQKICWKYGRFHPDIPSGTCKKTKKEKEDFKNCKNTKEKNTKTV